MLYCIEVPANVTLVAEFIQVINCLKVHTCITLSEFIYVLHYRASSGSKLFDNLMVFLK